MILETNSDLLSRYLRAWETYDTKLLREIFETSSVYNIEGKEPLRGIEEICRYWERNRKRQHNLKIRPPLKQAITDDVSVFIFCASFVDLEEKEHQTVYGQITLQHSNGKIVELTETYLLDRLPFPHDSLGYEAQSPTYLRLAREIARPYWWLKDQSKIVAEFLLTRITTFFISLMAVVLGYSALQLNEWPDSALNILAFKLPTTIPLSITERQFLTAIAYRHLSTFASLFVFVVLAVVWLRYRIRQPIRITNLQAEDHDLAIMKSRFKLARRLLIFAGDFDFIKRDPELRSMFRRLHAQNNLTLVSDKSEKEVREGFGNRPDAVFLLEGLIQKGQIYFSKEPSIRCSIVRGWLGSEIIYRYEGGGADSFNNLHLCIMRGRREARPLMDLLERLAKPT